MPGGGPPWPGACCILYTPKISKNCPCNDGKNDGNVIHERIWGNLSAYSTCLAAASTTCMFQCQIGGNRSNHSEPRLARHQHRPVMMRGFGTLGVWKCSDILDKETSNLRGTSRVSNFLWGFWAYQQCLDKWFSASASFKSERKLWHVGLGDRFTLLCIEARLKDHLCSHHQGVAINPNCCDGQIRHHVHPQEWWSPYRGSRSRPSQCQVVHLVPSGDQIEDHQDLWKLQWLLLQWVCPSARPSQPQISPLPRWRDYFHQPNYSDGQRHPGCHLPE